MDRLRKMFDTENQHSFQLTAKCIQSYHYHSIGCITRRIIKPTKFQRLSLQECVGMVLYNVPSELPSLENEQTGYPPVQLAHINTIVSLIQSISYNLQSCRHNQNEIHFGFIFIIGKDEKKNQHYQHALFKIFKYDNSDEDCLYLDENGTMYTNLDHFLAANTLPPGQISFPTNGVYHWNLDSKTPDLTFHVIQKKKFNYSQLIRPIQILASIVAIVNFFIPHVLARCIGYVCSIISVKCSSVRLKGMMTKSEINYFELVECLSCLGIGCFGMISTSRLSPALLLMDKLPAIAKNELSQKDTFEIAKVVNHYFALKVEDSNVMSYVKTFFFPQYKIHFNNITSNLTNSFYKTIFDDLFHDLTLLISRVSWQKLTWDELKIKLMVELNNLTNKVTRTSTNQYQTIHEAVEYQDTEHMLDTMNKIQVNVSSNDLKTASDYVFEKLVPYLNIKAISIPEITCLRLFIKSELCRIVISLISQGKHINVSELGVQLTVDMNELAAEYERFKKNYERIFSRKITLLRSDSTTMLYTFVASQEWPVETLISELNVFPSTTNLNKKYLGEKDCIVCDEATVVVILWFEQVGLVHVMKRVDPDSDTGTVRAQSVGPCRLQSTIDQNTVVTTDKTACQSTGNNHNVTCNDTGGTVKEWESDTLPDQVFGPKRRRFFRRRAVINGGFQ